MEDFDWAPLKDVDDRVVFTVWGQKGSGKTTIAFGAPGERTVLSFDRKAMRVRRGSRFTKDNGIVVHDVTQFIDFAEDKYTESADKTFQYTAWLLSEIPGRGGTDWVIFDGGETFIKLVEMRMRYKFGYKVAQGIPERSVWNYRNLDIKLAHDLALQAARKGVIYTVQSVKDELVVDGTLVKSVDSPRWTDVIMTETDVVVQARSDPETGRFYAHVTTSKEDGIPTGAVYDVTDSALWDALDEQAVCPECGSSLVDKGLLVQCVKYPSCKYFAKKDATA